MASQFGCENWNENGLWSLYPFSGLFGSMKTTWWSGRGKILHDKEPGIKPVWWYHSRVRWVWSQRSCPHHTPPLSSRSWVKNINTSIQIILIFSLSTENNAVYYFFSWNKKTPQWIALAEQSGCKGIMANCVCLL